VLYISIKLTDDGWQTPSDGKNVKSVQMLDTKCWRYLIRPFGSADPKTKENKKATVIMVSWQRHVI